MFLQIADALPRKTVVDLSRGGRKHLRKRIGKCKADRAQAQMEPSTVSIMKHPRVTVEEIPDEPADCPLVRGSSSMISVESLTRKVTDVKSLIVFINYIIQWASRQENETRFTIFMNRFLPMHMDKSAATVTGTTSATMEIAKLSQLLVP